MGCVPAKPAFINKPESSYMKKHAPRVKDKKKDMKWAKDYNLI